MSERILDLGRINDEVIPLFTEAINYFKESATKIEIPSNFEYTAELQNIEAMLNDLVGDIGDFRDWLFLVVYKWNQAEEKSEEVLNQLINSLTVVGLDESYTQKYRENEKLNRLSGTYIKSNEENINGYYISNTGRIHVIFNQHYQEVMGTDKVKWNDKCNRAATIIMASAFSNETNLGMIDKINRYTGDRIIAGNDFWNEFGLERSDYYQWMPTYTIDTYQGYTEVLSEHMQNGGVGALIWLCSEKTDEGEIPAYKGKSGEKWTQEDVGIHWIAVIDYKKAESENEIDQIAIADARGVEWYDIDEFTKNIGNMVLISEKK